MEIILFLTFLMILGMFGLVLYLHFNQDKKETTETYENIEQTQDPNFINWDKTQHLGWLRFHDNNYDLILYFDQTNATFFALPVIGDSIRMNLNVTPEQMKNGNIINHNGFEYKIEFFTED